VETDPAAFRRPKALFRVRAPGFLDRSVHLDAAQAEAIREGRAVRGLDVVLVPPALVEGRVLDPYGRPVEGAVVRLTRRPEQREPTDGPRVRTAADGSFRFPRVDPTADWRLVSWRKTEDGELRARPRAIGLAPARGARAWMEVDLTPVREVELTVSIHGHVPGMKVVVDRTRVPADSPLLRTKARTGPQRLRLKDATCSLVGERTVDIPADARGWHVEIEAGEGESGEK